MISLRSKSLKLGWDFILYLFLLIAFLELATSYRRYDDIQVAKNSCVNGQIECIEKLIKATRWSSPFDNYSEILAIELLHAIKNSKTIETAIKVKLLWELRSALYGSRSWLVNKTILGEIDRSIGLDLVNTRIVDPGNEPDHFYQFLAQIFFWCWITSALLTIWHSFDANLKLKFSNLLKHASFTTIVFLAWLFCLHMA